MAYSSRDENMEKDVVAYKIPRGFAAMSKDKVKEIARIGGKVRSQQIEEGGYVSLGRKGGRMRAAQMNHGKYVLMGRMGGISRGLKARSVAESLA
ncbi:MAG: hypothetical protein LBQ43_01410 [Holosporales bacterium]|jgi:general stress protein YciG|nr:hypothetical protein [Holosporales bacterium]